jgi:hypothetical protein
MSTAFDGFSRRGFLAQASSAGAMHAISCAFPLRASASPADDPRIARLRLPTPNRPRGCTRQEYRKPKPATSTWIPRNSRMLRCRRGVFVLGPLSKLYAQWGAKNSPSAPDSQQLGSRSARRLSRVRLLKDQLCASGVDHPVTTRLRAYAKLGVDANG